MTKHPCAGLSRAAHSAFERVAISMEPLASLRTINKLLESGLIEVVGQLKLGTDAFGPVTIPIYAVPLPVHYQWCKWASENATDTSPAIPAGQN